MLSLRRVLKDYEEAGSLNAMVNLVGFVGPHVFLTKSGEIGVILEIAGVDYECLETAAVDALTKRLESALRLFDESYRVYQLLFKRNRQSIPHSFCGIRLSMLRSANAWRIFRKKPRTCFRFQLTSRFYAPL